jgi:23S rRNA pseudouridine1911/1915/1917 synthase
LRGWFKHVVHGRHAWREHEAAAGRHRRHGLPVTRPRIDRRSEGGHRGAMSDAPETLRIPFPAEDSGSRLDQALARHVAALSRSRLQALIRDGRLTLDGREERDPSRRLAGGEEAALEIPPPEPATPRAQDIPLDVVHEDADLIVIDKPAGLVVHPAAGHAEGTLVNALIAHCGESLSGVGGERRPGIVHRLDKDTSGLLVVAKNDVAHHGLSAQFAAHGRDGRLERVYEALVWGRPRAERGTVDRPIGRDPRNREKMAVVPAAKGREAITHYTVEESFAGPDGEPLVCRLSCRLETGRTHQIRVHLASIGHPLLGDAAYGAGFRTKEKKLSETARAALDALGRQALHARVLGFEHPVTGKQLCFERPPPADLAALVAALRETARG